LYAYIGGTAFFGIEHPTSTFRRISAHIEKKTRF